MERRSNYKNQLGWRDGSLIMNAKVLPADYQPRRIKEECVDEYTNHNSRELLCGCYSCHDSSLGNK